MTFSPTGALNLYLGYSEGSRAPTSIELGCANPEQACKLPNALAGDPPLEQVVTRTWEAGLRGVFESSVNWNAGWFRADNRNDVLFVASTQTGFGYFRNFMMPAWKKEGYSEYIAGGSTLDYESGVKLWKANPGDGTGYQYFKYYLTVKYVLETDKISVEDLFNRDLDRAQLEQKVLTTL